MKKVIAVMLVLFLALLSVGVLTHNSIQKNEGNAAGKTEESENMEVTTEINTEVEDRVKEETISAENNQLKCTGVDEQTYYTDQKIEFTVSDDVEIYTDDNEFKFNVVKYNQYEDENDYSWTCHVQCNYEIINVKYSAYEGTVSLKKKNNGNSVILTQEFSGPNWDTFEISLNADGEIYTAIFKRY